MTIKYLDLKKVTERHAEEIHEAVARVIDSGWYLQGEAVARFEEEYARYCGVRHCIACGNGLDALTLILRAYIEMGVMAEGDEVIVPANTYIATILSITENGLVPVLVEPRLDTFQIDDALIEQAITERTRAVMIVHLYGRMAYTDRIGDICRRHGARLEIRSTYQKGTTIIIHMNVAPIPKSQGDELEALLQKRPPREKTRDKAREKERQKRKKQRETRYKGGRTI